MSTLMKSSPVEEVHLRLGAELRNEHGWSMPWRYREAEHEELDDGCALVDHSYITKVRVRGTDAVKAAESFLGGRSAPAVQHAAGHASVVVLCLVDDEVLVLGRPGNREQMVTAATKLAPGQVVDESGGMCAITLLGPRRAEVWERSSAMNLTARHVPDGGVVQTSVHTIPCMFYRMGDRDMLLCTRDLAVSLWDALEDVGRGVGLKPVGIAAVPFEANGGRR